MPRRKKQKPSLLAPAESLIRRLSNADARFRRKVIRGSIWIISLLFLYSLLSGSYGIPRIVRLKMEKEALIKKNRELSAELVDSYRIRNLLIDDPAYIEKIARTRYYMVRRGETIYRYRGL